MSKTLTLFCRAGLVAGLLLTNDGRSSVNDVNDKLGLDVLKSSSTTYDDNLDVYNSFLNVLLGLVPDSAMSCVLLMLFDGVTIFNERDETIAFLQSSGCFVVTRSEPLVKDNVRMLPFGELAVCFTVFSFPSSSFKGINLRTLAFVFWVVACLGLPEADRTFDGLLIRPYI